MHFVARIHACHCSTIFDSSLLQVRDVRDQANVTTMNLDTTFLSIGEAHHVTHHVPDETTVENENDEQVRNIMISNVQDTRCPCIRPIIMVSKLSRP